MPRCGCAGGGTTCSCAVASGNTTQVSGDGSIENPYVIETTTPAVPDASGAADGSTLAVEGGEYTLLPPGGGVTSEIITRAAYDALGTPDPSTIYLIQEPDGLMGGFKAQGDLQYPATYSALGSQWLVDYKAMAIVEPTFRLVTSLGSVVLNPGSAALVPGSNLIIMTGFTGGTPSVFFYSTTSRTIVATTTITGAGSTPVYGPGALASDGLVYFAPVSGGGAGGFLKVDPSANTAVLDTFSGTYVNQPWGWACTGGDGMVYFLPGFVTAAGGSYVTGTKWAYLDPSTHVLTVVNIPSIVPPFTDNNFASSSASAATDGIYATDVTGYTLYKFTVAGGAVILEDLSALSPGINFFSGLTPLSGTKLVGFAAGTNPSTNGSIPTLVAVDKADDSVKIYQVPEAVSNQVSFNPCATFVAYGSLMSVYPISPQRSGFDVPPGYPDMFTAWFIGEHITMKVGALPLRGSI